MIKADQSLKGTLPLFASAQKYFEEFMSGTPRLPGAAVGELAAEELILRNLKKLAVLLFGASVRKYRDAIAGEQEVLARLANASAAVFALESGILRARKLAGRRSSADVEKAMVRIAAKDACDAVAREANDIAARLAAGDDLRIYQSVIRRLTKYETPDVIGLKRLAADRYLQGLWKFV